jgi:hypothetical protein
LLSKLLCNFPTISVKYALNNCATLLKNDHLFSFITLEIFKLICPSGIFLASHSSIPTTNVSAAHICTFWCQIIYFNLVWHLHYIYRKNYPIWQ